MPTVLKSVTRKLSKLLSSETPTDNGSKPPNATKSRPNGSRPTQAAPRSPNARNGATTESQPRQGPARATTETPAKEGPAPRKPRRRRPRRPQHSTGGAPEQSVTKPAGQRRRRPQHSTGGAPEQSATKSAGQRRGHSSKASAAPQYRRESTVSSAEWTGSGLFGEIPVSPEVDRALVDMGYSEPTPIQNMVVPLIREGRDVVGQAQTGTGKTASFGIPIVETVDPAPGDPQALVLAPTRELALQVCSEISAIGHHRGISVVAIYGGQPMQPQIDAVKRGAHVIVATPGRLMDHMQRRTLSLSKIRIAVLDEADQMLDIGFIDDIEHILRQTPRNRQTLLFSATIPYPIRKLTRRYLHDPEWVRVGGEAEPVDEVNQVYYEVALQDRRVALKEVLDTGDEVKQALVFRRTRAGVDRLVRDLRRDGYDADGIHSDMTQAQRERVMSKFRSRDLRLLVATNVAARGLDIPAVSHVINYDMPDNLEEYVHRIGRTARAGKQGTAITFVSDLQDFELLDAMQEHLGHEMEQGNLAKLYNSQPAAPR